MPACHREERRIDLNGQEAQHHRIARPRVVRRQDDADACRQRILQVLDAAELGLRDAPFLSKIVRHVVAKDSSPALAVVRWDKPIWLGDDDVLHLRLPAIGWLRLSYPNRAPSWYRQAESISSMEAEKGSR